MKQKNKFLNKTKKLALEVLQDKTWMNVPALAGEVGIRPVRRAYTYLIRLEKLGLVIRERDARGKLRYQITDRGLERLHGFRSKEEATILDGMVGYRSHP